MTFPNTAKRYFVDGQTHFDFDIDPNPGPAVADDGKGSLGNGKGLISIRLTPTQAQALDGLKIAATMLSGAAGALKAALGRVTRGLAARVSATVSTGLRGLFGRGVRRALPAARSVQRAAGGTSTVMRGGAGPVRVGQAGEAAVRSVADIGPKTSISVAGRTRIPDGLDLELGRLSEVKNVQSLSYTRQLRDFAAYARENGLRFDLWVRPTTRLSGPLLDVIETGTINRRFIP